MSPTRLLPALLDEALIDESFVRSPGTGGQNVNKVATAVELRFNLQASAIADDVKTRLARLAGKRLTTEGVVVIQAHEYRTQAKNREAARDRLVDLFEQASRRPKARRATKPSKASDERRLVGKQRRGSAKAGRRRKATDDD